MSTEKHRPTREDIAAWPIEDWANLYKDFFVAYVLNTEDGHERAARDAHRVMHGILSAGKISEADRLEIEARTYRSLAWTRQLLDEICNEGRDPNPGCSLQH